MAGTAEEATEEIEWVMATTSTAALLVLREALMAILVVDFAGFGGGERVVGFGDLDKFFGGGLVSSTQGSALSAGVLMYEHRAPIVTGSSLFT